MLYRSARITPTETAILFELYIQSEMEVMLRAYMDLYTCIVYTIDA